MATYTGKKTGQYITPVMTLSDSLMTEIGYRPNTPPILTTYSITLIQSLLLFIFTYAVWLDCSSNSFLFNYSLLLFINCTIVDNSCTSGSKLPERKTPRYNGLSLYNWPFGRWVLIFHLILLRSWSWMLVF